MRKPIGEYFEIEDGWKSGGKVVCTKSNYYKYVEGTVYTLKLDRESQLFIDNGCNGHDGEFEKVATLYGWKPVLGDIFKCVQGGYPGSIYEIKDYEFYGLKAYRQGGYSGCLSIDNLELEMLFQKIKSGVANMKYQDKWILNEGQEIPENADKLEKDGSVVAYRLVREPQVGDMVYLKGSSWVKRKLLYIHHIDPKRKYGVVAYKGDIPESHKFENIKLAE